VGYDRNTVWKNKKNEAIFTLDAKEWNIITLFFFVVRFFIVLNYMKMAKRVS